MNERYYSTFNSNEMEKESFDLVIVGAGLAGLSAAYSASRVCPEKSIALLTTASLKESSSFNAQGGIAVALGKNDSWKKHYLDTIKCGEGLSDRKNVKILTKEGIERVKELIAAGLVFDSRDNELIFGLEGAHSVNRILHINGDGTGEGLITFMRSLVKEQKNVQLIKETYLSDLLVRNNRVQKIVVKQNDENKIIEANAFIIATGGYSALYEKTTNPAHSIGEGISIAFRAGAVLADLEFVQFHPTTLSVENERNFLISEAIRGKGALIVNENGERIMEKIDSRKELAPRDIVSRTVYAEIQKGKKVFLDCRHLDKEFLQKNFPLIFAKTKSIGLDISKQLIPIEPAAHYSIGGIAVDSFGRTNIKDLFAVGECSCTRVHGANRLASNSLLEAIVFGFRTGEQAVKTKRKRSESFMNKLKEKKGTLSNKLNKIMWTYCGIERNERMLKKGLLELKRINKHAAISDSIESSRFHNKLLLEKLIIESALKRKESRGVHFRTDFPSSKKAWERHSIINPRNYIKGH